MSIKLKNTNIKISALGEENTFVSGNKNWRLDWAKFEGNLFKAGTKVEWECPDYGKVYKGFIEYIIVVDNGNVEVSTSNREIGRLDLDELIFIK